MNLKNTKPSEWVGDDWYRIKLGPGLVIDLPYLEERFLLDYMDNVGPFEQDVRLRFIRAFRESIQDPRCYVKISMTQELAIQAKELRK